jgi:hypothetical protein
MRKINNIKLLYTSNDYTVYNNKKDLLRTSENRKRTNILFQDKLSSHLSSHLSFMMMENNNSVWVGISGDWTRAELDEQTTEAVAIKKFNVKEMIRMVKNGILEFRFNPLTLFLYIMIFVRSIGYLDDPIGEDVTPFFEGFYTSLISFICGFLLELFRIIKYRRKELYWYNPAVWKSLQFFFVSIFLGYNMKYLFIFFYLFLIARFFSNFFILRNIIAYTKKPSISNAWVLLLAIYSFLIVVGYMAFGVWNGIFGGLGQNEQINKIFMSPPAIFESFLSCILQFWFWSVELAQRGLGGLD